MKSSDKQKLAKLSLEELKQKQANIRSQEVTARHQIKLSQEKNLKKAKNLRYQIALINTLISQKQNLESKK